MRFETKTDILILLFEALPDGPKVNSITHRLHNNNRVRQQDFGSKISNRTTPYTVGI